MERIMPTKLNVHILELERPPISCKLNIAADQHIVDGVFVNFIVLNQSDNDLSVLTWNTPLAGFNSEVFIITDRYGDQVSYQGPMVERTKPTAVDYQLIRAWGNIAILLDLSSVYDLIPGEYKLQLSKKTLQVTENDMPMSICQCQTDTLIFNVN